MNGRKRFTIAIVIITGVLMLSSCTSGGSITVVEKSPGLAFDIIMKDWNGTDTVEMTLNAGDEVRVEITCESGSVALEMASKNGSIPYTGKDLADIAFTVTVEVTDTYTFTLNGDKVTGSLNIAR